MLREKLFFKQLVRSVLLVSCCGDSEQHLAQQLRLKALVEHVYAQNEGCETRVQVVNLVQGTDA